MEDEHRSGVGFPPGQGAGAARDETIADGSLTRAAMGKFVSIMGL